MSWDGKVSTSEIKTYQRCRREYQHKYIHLRVPICERGSEAASFGKLMHEGVAEWRETARGLSKAILKLEDKQKTTLYDMAKAAALMIGYHARWKDEPAEHVLTEKHFEFPRDGYLFEGVLDGVDIISGAPYVHELKTSGADITPGSIYRQRLALDEQITNYYDGAKALGHTVHGCVYDVIGKKGIPIPKKSRKTKEYMETPEQYKDRVLEKIRKDPEAHYQRSTLVRLKEELDMGRAEMKCLVDDMARVDAEALEPKNDANCVRFGHQLCPYFRVCTGEVCINDDTEFKDKKERVLKVVA